MDLNQIENELIVQHCDNQTRSGHPAVSSRHQQQQQWTNKREKKDFESVITAAAKEWAGDWVVVCMTHSEATLRKLSLHKRNALRRAVNTASSASVCSLHARLAMPLECVQRANQALLGWLRRRVTHQAMWSVHECRTDQSVGIALCDLHLIPN